jgi:hypothetical protein
MKKIFLTLLHFGIIIFTIQAQDIVKKANNFIGLLTEEQKSGTLFPFDNEERYNFHFVPFVRKGITFNEMNAQQTDAGLALLRACLSDNGYKKATEIVAMEAVLKEIENRKPEDKYRDPGNYHFSIFGIPSNKTIWGWRFEGHHISYNFSFDKKLIVSGTPGFMGSNPAVVQSGPQKGKNILKDETEEGFQVLNSLDQQQLSKAIIDTAAYKDILTFDIRSADINSKLGLKYTDMNQSQQALLLNLIKVYVNRYTHLFAESMLKDIQAAGLDNILFAWAGKTENQVGKPTYYRVQGPTFIIEYDNTQNNANHIHSVIRDLKNDFGGDVLLNHYKQDHQQ